MTRTEFAVARITEGYHCSQVVLEAWAQELGLDPMVARTVALPLAAGSGLGGECGAITGAFLVIGLKCGVNRAYDWEGFRTVISKVRELANGFKLLHGTLNCHDLLGLDVCSKEGSREFKEKGMILTHCVRHVEDVVNLLEQVLPLNTPMD